MGNIDRVGRFILKTTWLQINQVQLAATYLFIFEISIFILQMVVSVQRIAIIN